MKLLICSEDKHAEVISKVNSALMSRDIEFYECDMLADIYYYTEC